ncbi:MAG: SusC/RagA family TonB-linked outer membrane protein [Candidatus Kapaibacterium sp.]|nr:MAG: SusC/RagA family TonB-linked outer membrane protein [Candidatus Kapabacteria bacterium]
MNISVQRSRRVRWLFSRCVVITVIALCNILITVAQPRSITGKVTFKDTKSALPGAKITIKGMKRGGAISNKDGDYKIDVPDGSATLVFSLIGHLSKEIKVGEQTSINAELALDDVKLEEIVVTALGIEQQKRAVNYAVQDIKAGDIAESQQVNMVNAMQGRIAGVQITNSGGAAGGSSSIIIRGGNSVDSDNQPLFIIDGVPMDNSTTTETGAGTSGLNGTLARSVANSNRAMDINPEDIETISVLKGPSAAALYGSRAANGVVLITTKRGKEGTTNVTYNNAFSYDVVNRLPQLQNVYKQGSNGFVDAATRRSWGPRFQQGETVYDNLGSFFVPAFSMMHNITASGANENTNFLFSLNRTDQNGIVPMTNWTRTSLRLNAGAKVADRFQVQASLNYTNSGGNRALQGPGLFGSSGGILISSIYWPRNDQMSAWENPDGTRRRILTGAVIDDADNPYWTLRYNTINDDVNRFLGNVKFIYDPTDWLNITYIAGTDLTHELGESVRYPGTSLRNGNTGVSYVQGGISQSQNLNRIINSQLLVTMRKELLEGLDGELLIGNWIEANRNYQLDYASNFFINPDFVSINNTPTTENRVVERITEKRLVGLFAQANLNWQNKMFLSIRARNDWSSALPVNNRSYFYPAIDFGYVFTEDFLRGDVLSYGKIRASVAQVGKDAAAYRTNTALTSNIYLGGGFRNDFWAGNPTLKPEITQAAELGIDLRFFQGAINIDAAVYQQNTFNQLIAPRISQASGFIFAYLNGGTVENRGLEIAISGNPVRVGDFRWDVSANFTANQSRVTELPSVLAELNQSDAWIIDNMRGSSFPGQPLQAISMNDYNRNPAGRIIIDSATGLPTPFSSGVWYYGGNRQPDAIIGFNNSFQFGGFTFSFLWDIRIGGKVVNGTEWDMVRAGMSMRTLDRYKKVVLDGVIRNRAVSDANAPDAWIPNTREVELTEAYYRFTFAAAGSNFVEDGSWVRLRTVNLSYRFNKELLAGSFIKGLEFFATGRNLLLFTRYTGMDPEVSASGAGVRGAGSNGMDYGGVPATLGVTAGLKITF